MKTKKKREQKVKCEEDNGFWLSTVRNKVAVDLIPLGK